MGTRNTPFKVHHLRIFNVEQEKEITKRYTSGMSANNIAHQYGVERKTIIRTLRRNNAIVRTSSASLRLPHNGHAFNKLTEESAYWIGFLMADGCILSRRHNVPASKVVLRLSEKDKSHVYRFKRFLSAKHKIVISRNKYGGLEYGIAITSNMLVKDLSKYGVGPRKSFTAKALSGIEHNRHFWRGVIDGDGSIGTHRGHACISLNGSKALLKQFKQYIIVAISPQFGGAVRPIKNIFRIQAECKIARSIIDNLYAQCNIALPRKYAISKRLLREHHTQ